MIDDDQAGAMTRRDTAAVMERFLELMPIDVLAAVRETTADDLIWWVPQSLGGGVIWRSKAEALDRLVEAHKKNFEPGTMVITQRRATLVSDTHGVAEFDLAAHTVTGKPYDNAYVMVFGFDDQGRINSIREHMDSKRIVDIMRS
jgi:ketosteroid isomerase-like protein